MRAKEYMLQIRKCDAIIKNKTCEMQEMKEIAYSTGGISYDEKVQSSPNLQKMQDRVVGFVSIEEEIQEEIIAMIKKKQEIISTIQKLPTLEYDVLHKMYVGKSTPEGERNYYELNQIADIYENSYSWASSVHGTALKHLQEIIDKC